MNVTPLTVLVMGIGAASTCAPNEPSERTPTGRNNQCRRTVNGGGCWRDGDCVYRKLMRGRSGGEVRHGWRVI